MLVLLCMPIDIDRMPDDTDCMSDDIDHFISWVTRINFIIPVDNEIVMLRMLSLQ